MRYGSCYGKSINFWRRLLCLALSKGLLETGSMPFCPFGPFISLRVPAEVFVSVTDPTQTVLSCLCCWWCPNPTSHTSDTRHLTGQLCSNKLDWLKANPSVRPDTLSLLHSLRQTCYTSTPSCPEWTLSTASNLLTGLRFEHCSSPLLHADVMQKRQSMNNF